MDGKVIKKIEKAEGVSSVKKRYALSFKDTFRYALKLGEAEQNILSSIPDVTSRQLEQKIYSQLKLDVTNEVICCIYPQKTCVELNIKNNTDESMALNVMASRFSVFSSSGRQYDLAKRWYRNETIITIAPGKWFSFHADELPMDPADAESYLVQLVDVNGASLYLFALGPRFPQVNKRIYEMFDKLSLKHNELLEKYEQQESLIKTLENQIAEELKSSVKKNEMPQVNEEVSGNLKKVVNYPKRDYCKKALKQIFEEMSAAGLQLELDGRFIFVRISCKGQEIGQVVPKQNSFNIRIGDMRFEGVEDIHPWYSEISLFLFELLRRKGFLEKS